MRGPSLRLTIDVRRTWRCPRCGYERHAPATETTVRCHCSSDQPWMKLVEPVRHVRPPSPPLDPFIDEQTFGGELPDDPFDTMPPEGTASIAAHGQIGRVDEPSTPNSGPIDDELRFDPPPAETRQPPSFGSGGISDCSQSPPGPQTLDSGPLPPSPPRDEPDEGETGEKRHPASQSNSLPAPQEELVHGDPDRLAEQQEHDELPSPLTLEQSTPSEGGGADSPRRRRRGRRGKRRNAPTQSDSSPPPPADPSNPRSPPPR